MKSALPSQFVAFGRAGETLKNIQVAVVNPDQLLNPTVASALPPVAGMALTTINLTVNGRAIPAGDYTFTPMRVKAKALAGKRIGNGYVEQARALLRYYIARNNFF